MEQVVGIASHQRACEQQRLAALAGQHAHGLALGRSLVLVLVPLVDDEQPEIPARQIPLDELGRLVAAFSEAELEAGQGPLHACGLPVAEDQIPLLVHEVEELVDVVTQHGAEQVLAKRGEQTISRLGADGGHLLQSIRHQVPEAALRATRSHERPQSLAAGIALTAMVSQLDGCQLGGQRQDVSVVVFRAEQRSAARASRPAELDQAVRTSLVGGGR